jgi:hypothetical protein
MTKRENILQALRSGCYLAEFTSGRLYLVNDLQPWYKRLVPIAILSNLLDAGLVSETAAGVWQAS